MPWPGLTCPGAIVRGTTACSWKELALAWVVPTFPSPFSQAPPCPVSVPPSATEFTSIGTVRNEVDERQSTIRNRAALGPSRIDDTQIAALGHIHEALELSHYVNEHHRLYRSFLLLIPNHYF